jgi:hypothetical protein
MFSEEKRMSARVRFSDGEEPEAQLELEPELANRLFQALLWILNYLDRMWFQHFGNSRMQCWGSGSSGSPRLFLGSRIRIH